MNLPEKYWQTKVSMWLHDPVDKALNIREHEQHAKNYAEALYIKVPEKNDYQNADRIASGLARSALPGRSEDKNQDGSVDFTSHPTLKHPLTGEELKLNSNVFEDVKNLQKDISQLLTEDCKFFDNQNAEERAKLIFFYLFFAFKKRLHNKNIGGLGGFWDLLPADTRMPDHSIWHHNALTSAIGSCMKTDADNNISMAVFSIAPVQAFIAKSRKLRDHWVASVILSYLSFTGIRYIAEEFGPDHIVYPSLHNQSLIEAWLSISKKFHLENILSSNEEERKSKENSTYIASFPNKFVFLAPSGLITEILNNVKDAVKEEWKRIAGIVIDFIRRETQANTGKLEKLFSSQVADFWDYSWAALHLLDLKSADDLEKVFDKSKWEKDFKIQKDFAKAYNAESYARIYSATHSFCQTLLAALKLKPSRIKKSQNGEKCPLCGEHEVLHDFTDAENTSAGEYTDSINNFWDKMRKLNSIESFAEIGDKERLCALCTIKRLLPRALKENKLRDELLFNTLVGNEAYQKFPSTTGVAAHSFIKKLKEKGILKESNEHRFINELHNQELKPYGEEQSDFIRDIVDRGKKCGIEYTDRDKYYAILLMDGDRMGDLINGDTIKANFREVLHPSLQYRYKNNSFQSGTVLRQYLESKRTLNPAVHAAVSESLNNFAHFSVAPIIQRCDGKLIYAGGDDLCAILPLYKVLDAAESISKAYTTGFVQYSENGTESISIANSNDRIAMHLGKADYVSVSGALVICHHKEPLREVLRDAHALLDGVAKKKAGRNALAIKLMKRSGQDRVFYFKWDQKNSFIADKTIIESFKAVMEEISDKDISSSLAYRLNGLKNSLEPLIADFENEKERIVKLFAYELNHSGVMHNPGWKDLKKEEKEKKLNTIASHLAGICISYSASNKSTEKNSWFNPEAPVIARFLAQEKEGN